MQEDKFKLTRSLISVLVIFTIIFLLIVFKPVKVVFWIIGLVVFWSMIFFGTKLVQKNNLLEKDKEKETKLPNAEGPEKLKEIITKRIVSFAYWNHIKRFGKVIPHSSGKNLIYQFEVDFVYPDKSLGEGCLYIINAHYPNQRYSIISKDASQRQINLISNSLSTNPEEPLDVEKRTEIDLDRGKQIVYEKKTKPKKKDEKTEIKKTEDLA